ncbi:MAG: anti-sigma factor [Acidobacteriaceae bacterium]
MQRVLTGIGPAKPPADLGLRLRVAISQEKARTTRRRLEGWQLYWENSMAPFLVRGAAGLATSMILLGALALMVGTVAAPPPVAATETTAETTTTPRFMYTVGGTDSRSSFNRPVLVEVAVSKTGRVYDYRIVSGPTTKDVRDSLDSILLMSHFTPAEFYGIPVSGSAILSFSGVAVRG